MQLIPHNQAHGLLDGLSGDPDTIAALRGYIASQAALERWDNATIGRTAAAADRRATEAIHRTITLADDLGDATARIAALEESNRDLTDILGEVLAAIEKLSPPS